MAAAGGGAASPGTSRPPNSRKAPCRPAGWRRTGAPGSERFQTFKVDSFDAGFFFMGWVTCVFLLQWRRRKVLINGGLKSEGGPSISQLDTGLNARFKIKPIDSI